MKKNSLKTICIALFVIVIGVFSGCLSTRPKVPKKPTFTQTEGDFTINLSVSSQICKKGENIEVEAAFTNRSGDEKEIFHAGAFLMRLMVVKYDEPARPNIVTYALIEQFPAIYQSWAIGSNLKKGKYELVADSLFTLKDNPTEPIAVYSNTIILTVD